MKHFIILKSEGLYSSKYNYNYIYIYNIYNYNNSFIIQSQTFRIKYRALFFNIFPNYRHQVKPEFLESKNLCIWHNKAKVYLCNIGEKWEKTFEFDFLRFRF